MAERQTSARFGLRYIQSLEATILLHFPGGKLCFPLLLVDISQDTWIYKGTRIPCGRTKGLAEGR